jgi:hypothetical protein
LKHSTLRCSLMIGFAFLSNCKHYDQQVETSLSSIDGALIERGDPSIYFLDERKLATDPKLLNNGVIYRVECAGKERYMRATAENYLRECLVIEQRPLGDWLNYQLIPSLTVGSDLLSLDQKRFIFFLISNLRTFKNQNQPMQLNIPSMGSIEFGVQEAVYSESFQRWFPRIERFFDYRVPASKISGELGRSLKVPVQGDWAQWFIDFEALPAIDQLSLELASSCRGAISSVRAYDGQSWQTFYQTERRLDGQGWVSQLQLKALHKIAIKQLRIAFRNINSRSCEVKISSQQINPIPSQGSQKPTTTSERQASSEDQSQQTTPDRQQTAPDRQQTTPDRQESQQAPAGRSLKEQYERVREMFAAPAHRLHHLMWHSIRNSWNRDNMTDNDRKSLASAISGQNWQPLRPMVYDARGVDVMATEARYPGAGEDFFHMHRRMINRAKTAFEAGQFPVITSVQQAFDKREELIRAGIAQRVPVPSVADFRRRLGQIQLQEQTVVRALKQGVSLGYLGSLIEWTVHNAFHDLFSRPIAEIQLTSQVNPWRMGTRFFDGTFLWNQKGYEHLGDPYASATNPLFWVIHSYVDQWVERWIASHPSYDEISDNCQGRRRCYQWLQTARVSKPWDGPDHQGHARQGQPIGIGKLKDSLVREMIARSTFTSLR